MQYIYPLIIIILIFAKMDSIIFPVYTLCVKGRHESRLNYWHKCEREASQTKYLILLVHITNSN